MRKKIGTGVIGLWIVGSVLWLSADTMMTGALGRPGEEPESILPRTNVTVTATVVRLTQEVYGNLGGALLGPGDPDAVVAALADHVRDHPDVVIVGAQVRTANHETNECGNTRSIYHPRRGVRKSQEFDAYEYGKLFSARVSVLDYRRISIEYTWEYSWFDEEKSYRPVPPVTDTWSWLGTINTLPEKSVIAGYHLDGDHIVLLVLAARIDE